MGIIVEPGTAALGRYLDKWLEASAKPSLRAKTLGDYDVDVVNARRHLPPITRP